jgi:thiol-disulfide isomerase/thioredoxin
MNLRFLTKALSAIGGSMLLLFATTAGAIEFKAYTPEAFAAAQADGSPIVIDVHAGWCPTCQAQRRVIDQLADDPLFDEVVVFTIDYDSEKAYMRMHRVSQRSTLISFSGSQEIGRLHAVTSFSGIEALFLSVVE